MCCEVGLRRLPSFVFVCLEADAAEKLVLVPGSGHIINKDNLIKYVLLVWFLFVLLVWFHFVLLVRHRV